MGNDMKDDSKEVKKDNWSDAINKVVNVVVFTALLSVVFGFFSAYGALMALMIFRMI